MGSNKRDHIRAIIYAPHVTRAWEAAHGGAAPTEADVDSLYAAFTPIQIEVRDAAVACATSRNA